MTTEIKKEGTSGTHHHSASSNKPVENSSRIMKALLASYMDTASESLTGPSSPYILPPDVELSLENSGSTAEIPAPSNNASDSKMIRHKHRPPPKPNGYTLSRIDGNKSRHLSGEMIRRILERQKGSAAIESSSKTNNDKKPPMFFGRDLGSLEMRETLLWGERIACFNVGGEDRCCLPQILNSILDSISLAAIHAACDDLRIYCPTVSSQQLSLLKNHSIIPTTASTCGLITKSDAERLFSVLLDKNPPQMLRHHASEEALKVSHECFGRNFGLLYPSLYSHPGAGCLICMDCGGAFSPNRFVCHVHGYSAEKRTVHWGFDSGNWRAYLRLVEEAYHRGRDREDAERILEEVKGRYSVSKRAASEPSDNYPLQDSGGKKPRVIDPGVDPLLEPSSGSQPQQQQQPSSQAPLPNFSTVNNIYNLYNSWAAIVSKKHSSVLGWSSTNNAAGQHSKPASSTSSSASYSNCIQFAGGSKVPSTPSSSVVVTTAPGNAFTARGEERKTSSQLTSLSEGKKEEVIGGEILLKQNFNSSLADDINAIRDALEGASAIAKERTLKTLERITARLAQTEMERDIAIANYNELQKENLITQEELFKKRAELRELLAQDSSKERPSVTLELLRTNNNSAQHNSSDTSCKNTINTTNCNVTLTATPSTSCLPKIDLKSPADLLIQENELRESPKVPKKVPNNVASSCNNNTIVTPGTTCMNGGSHFKPSSDGSLEATSDKVKDSEDLRDRMVFMEAELRALRHELKNRVGESNSSSPKSSTTTTTTTNNNSHDRPGGQSHSTESV